MRITNKIMQNNNLANINTNKIYQDRLSNQMSTQKKVNRPSDDPVVAIRALRLRSSVTEISQYYDKNIPDAESWLSVTEDALKNLSEIVTNMIEQSTKGSNGELTTEDRQIILEQLNALGDEVYTTGDADYAGRYVFAGYRTDTSLSFTSPSETNYTITEQMTADAITDMTQVEMGEVLNWNSTTYNTTPVSDIKESDVEALEVYRIRLSYSDCRADGMAPTITYNKSSAEDAGTTLTATMMHNYAEPDPYTVAATTDDAVIYVPETGEILLGKAHKDAMLSVKDDPTTLFNEGEIQITYQKNDWEVGDLRPEHYFSCKADVVNADGSTEVISYNDDYLTGTSLKQVIEYDVGFNQTIQVNSTADECFKLGIGREVDDLVNVMQEVIDLENVVDGIESKMECTTDEAELKLLQTQLDAANKALTLSKDKSQKMFESSITSFQGYLDDINLSITNCGTRSKKLELIESRMQNQKTTFETLKSENEDVDITEVAIQLNSAEMTYEAALMATGKVMQTSLLNFI